MLTTEKQTDHFMVGEAVAIDGDQGVIRAVIEHTYEDDDGRHTDKRVLVDLGDREMNCSSDRVEVVR